MCLGDVFNRNKSSAPQAPATDVTSGEQIEIDQTVTSSNRTSGGRKGASNPGSGASRRSGSNKSRTSSPSRSRTGTPKSSRRGGRSRSRGGGR